ncbi:ABC transporter B family member 11-like [Nymphaea colorata]|nr:ABC transporter B family member 11-like [Nymphaea colorata]
MEKENHINGSFEIEDYKDSKKEEREGGGNGGLNNTIPFYKLFSFADSLDVMLMVIGTVGALGNGMGMPLLSMLFGDLIDSFGKADQHNVLHMVTKVCLKFFYLGLGCAAAAFLQVACWMIAGERQAARIRSLYLNNILRQDIAFFDMETTTGEVIGRMTADTILIQDAIGEKVGKFVQLISTFLGGFLIAFTKGWLLSLIMLSGIPPVVLDGVILAWVISKISSHGQKAYHEVSTIVGQTVGSIRMVASFTGEKQAIAKYNERLKPAYKATIYEGAAAGIGLGSILLIIFASYGLAVFYGARLIIHKGYTGGQVVSVMVAIMNGGTALGQASPCMTAFAAGKAAAYKMFETIERKPEIDTHDKSGIVLDDIRGDIELKDVHFSYPARPDVLIFSGLSLQVPSGETVALVGGSGSGKSTVISLVQRFYDPQVGQVFIDGVDLKKLKLSWIREKIGLVSQEPVLFTTTIRENIAYGKAGATFEEIRTAAELANAAKFIDRMPEGLDTMVGEHGTQLSGGQKQRIAIARAILKNPRILLLDEATSALDAESEKMVQEALTKIMVGRSTIVIAHRLTTIRNADMIVVMHRGEIVEKGSHAELIKDPDGAYSQLIRMQEISQVKEEVVADADEVGANFDANSAPSRSESMRFGLNRSISRGSSLGCSSRHSFPISLGLPGALSIHHAGPVYDNDVGIVYEKTNEHVSLSRLGRLNKPELPVLLLGCFAAAINGIIFPLLGVVMSSIIKTFFEPPHLLRRDANFWALMFVGLGLLAQIVSPTQMYLFAVAGGKLVRRVRALTFEHVVHQEMSWFDEPINSSGAIGARLSADAATLRSLVGDALSLVVQNISTIIAGLLIAFIANWELALIILGLIPMIGLQSFFQVKFLDGFSADAKKMYEEASQVANDAVGSIRTVASFCAEERVMELYRKKCETPKKNGIRLGIVSGLGFGFSFFALYCAYSLSFYAGARLVQDGKTDPSKVFRVFLALTMTAMGVSFSSAVAPDLAKAKASAASIFSILDRKSKIDPSDNSGLTLPTVKGNIDFQHVSFKYPTRPNVQIFRDLCLSIPSGKTVALVGESGSGKSTVISLLERFYEPDAGRILVDGIEIHRFQLRWLRQQMGLVSQEPVLFNDSIRANIAYGKPGSVTEEEIVAAARAANAHGFISALPHGYDTPVGERGVQLSGGQKQRIAIARAIIKDPKILLLDEATSALDTESERIVQEALDGVMVSRSTIAIAHRLSTISGADVIAVVKNGAVAEQGTHETLIGVKGGLYASLVALHSGSP